MANECLTRLRLITKLSDKLDIDPKKSKETTIIILTAMAKTLAAKHRIEIRRFGSFEIRTRTAKYARNPKTGETLLMGNQYSTHFKVGEPLRNRINHKLKIKKINRK
ncbi:MAG: integration host factor subunit beta [Francisellaceae bacterium]|jgi:integration host factor subunit beta